MFNKINIIIKRTIWRKRNQHNSTTIGTLCNIDNISVGNGTYGRLNVKHYNPSGRLSIGNYVSIADDVIFLLGGGHDYNRISTYPFSSKIYKQKQLENEKTDITVEDDVWIGYGVVILPGVRIGKGTVVGARSIVARDVAPYSVFVGNSVIKKRFSANIVRQLGNIDWTQIKHQVDDEYSCFAQTSITEDNIQEVLGAFIHGAEKNE